MVIATTLGQRLLAISLTLLSLAALVVFGLAVWITGLELANSHQPPAHRWLGVSLGAICAVAFFAGPVASWGAYMRARLGRAAGFMAAPYGVLALCLAGLSAWGR